MTIELTDQEAVMALQLWELGLKAVGAGAVEAYLVLSRKIKAAQGSLALVEGPPPVEDPS